MFHFHPPRHPRTHRAPSFATAVVLVWHRSARSNLINSCKFNYWLTAPRLRALYLLLTSLRASISSCFAYLFFFILFFSFTANKPISAFTVFARFLRLQFLGGILWRTRLLVNGRMWDSGSTYMDIRGLNKFQPSSRVFLASQICRKK